MNKRWVSGFTVVELVIVILVIGILASVTIIGFNAAQKTALTNAAKSDLSRLAAEMKMAYTKTQTYPSTLPSVITPSSDKLSLSLATSSSAPYYSNLTAVQNGTLLSDICNALVSEGVGKGVDQGGTTRDYVSGCGNWNDDSMQVTAWETQVWATPVSKAQLTNYAANFSVANTFHKQGQEATVKNFYTQWIQRFEQQGGQFPVSSFWDYWATPTNGGVMPQPLPSNPERRGFYCAQATTNSGQTWRVTQSSRVEDGSC